MTTEEQAAPDPELLAIEQDDTLNAVEKARKRQAHINAKILAALEEEDVPDKVEEDDQDVEHLKCGICLGLCDRPVTAPCQHNFCLKCFRKWVNQEKKHCPSCRAELTRALINNPRINTMLTGRIREAQKPKSQRTAACAIRHVPQDDRPDDAFMTENAKRKGLSNAASGRMRVTCPPHHFGPIGPDFDPERGRGVLVGECWQNRLHCRQWGSHLPHVAGIAGQSEAGAQSVVLSGGYVDDRDEGEWFLYTGSGGRDLSGNKRTNKEQAFDQKFESSNKALMTSCVRGLPVRVVRSFKEKRSAYAPTDAEWGLRYDGVYKIVACWRIPGEQGRLVCRYLFRRCDNEAAPWSGADAGDAAWAEDDLPEEAVAEIAKCSETVCYAGQGPHWDYLETEGKWGWAKEAPEAAAPGAKRVAKNKSAVDAAATDKRAAERALSKFACQLCKAIMEAPVCTPCGHYFCKGCLEGKHAAGAPAAGNSGARTFRTRKVPKPCPKCNASLTDFMTTLQVHQALAAEIVQHQGKVADAAARLDAAREAAAAAVAALVPVPPDAAPAAAATAVGWSVDVWWPEEDTWFRGTVDKATDDGKVGMKYTDGDYQEHYFAEETFRWLQEAPAADADASTDAVADAAPASNAVAATAQVAEPAGAVSNAAAAASQRGSDADVAHADAATARHDMASKATADAVAAIEGVAEAAEDAENAGPAQPAAKRVRVA